MTPKAPDGYRHHTPMIIRYGDMDTLGHVNNAKYLTYIEHARVGYFRQIELWHGGLSQLGLIVAKSVVEYKMPLTMDHGLVDVWTRCSRLGNKSFDMEHMLTIDGPDGLQVAATGMVVIVVFDYEQNLSVPIPEDWRNKLRNYEPGLE